MSVTSCFSQVCTGAALNDAVAAPTIRVKKASTRKVLEFMPLRIFFWIREEDDMNGMILTAYSKTDTQSKPKIQLGIS